MSKLNYIIKRVLQMIPVVLVSAVLIFVMIRMIPGDPARIMVGERALPEVYEAYREKMGLNESYFTQFMRFLKSKRHTRQGCVGRHRKTGTSTARNLVFSNHLVTLCHTRNPITASRTD